ncbi:MAG: aryl-sulfate sulfotransferase [Bacteroidota bacterium]
MKNILPILFLFLLINTSSAQRTVGIFQNESDAFDGYTLIAPSGTRMVWLINNCGEVVNEWLTTERPGEVTYLLPDGRLLRTIRVVGDFNGGGLGGQLELYSWEGDLIWSYKYANSARHQHHDLELLPNGNILVLAWESRTRTEAVNAGRVPGMTGSRGVWPEQVVEIQPVGSDAINIVWEWHLWDHLVQDYDDTKANYGVVADHPELVDVNYNTAGGGADWIHANSVDYNPELDQIIINSRNFGEFWVIDHSTTTEEAAGHSGGNSGKGGDILYRWGNPQVYGRGAVFDQKLFGQHDAHWIEKGLPSEGQIMIFNNGLGRPEGAFSTIEVIQPPMDGQGNYIIEAGQAFGPDTVSWNYTDPQFVPFNAPRVSGAQRQPNGNTLICEGTKGHVFEINTEKEIVWDFIVPVFNGNVVAQGSSITPSSLFRAYRYAPDYPAFRGRDLTAGPVIELDPLPSECMLFTSVTTAQRLNDVYIIENPVRDYLKVRNATGRQLEWQLYDLSGRLLKSQRSADQQLEWSLGNWPAGLYVLRASTLDQQQFSIHKFVKQ